MCVCVCARARVSVHVHMYIMLVVINCIVDGGWSNWSVGNCSVSCVKKKTRNCSNPVPSCGGKNCSGPAVEMVNCTESPCRGLFMNFDKMSRKSLMLHTLLARI